MPGEVPLGLALFCSSWELGEQLAKFPAVFFILLFKIRDDKGHDYKTQITSMSVGRGLSIALNLSASISSWVTGKPR